VRWFAAAHPHDQAGVRAAPRRGDHRGVQNERHGDVDVWQREITTSGIYQVIARRGGQYGASARSARAYDRITEDRP
jgi:hypothetical protein